MTIVPENKVKHDPQKLLYHFPSISTVRYTKLVNEYSFWRAVELAERTAAMFGRQLVPARCLHWERKLKFQDRQLQIGKSSFYVLSLQELTINETQKYMSEVQEVEAVAN